MFEKTGKFVKEKADKTLSFTKKTIGILSTWGLVFSLVTIGELRVGFDYDDTLVYSSPSYEQGFASGAVPYSPQFWKVVNSSYDQERLKPLPFALAWAFRIFGFKITLITSRPDFGGEALRKEWRHLASEFVFAGGSKNKHKTLTEGHYVLFFGDSDSDITESRRAKVLALRVKRSPKSTYKEDYNPGALRELVIPFSEF